MSTSSPDEKRSVDEQLTKKSTAKKGKHGAKEKGSDSSSTSTIPVQDEQQLQPVPFSKLFQVWADSLFATQFLN
jgi:hypothetical protein